VAAHGGGADLDAAVAASRTISLALRSLYNQNSPSLKTRSVREVADDARRGEAAWWGNNGGGGGDCFGAAAAAAATAPTTTTTTTTNSLLSMYRHHATIILTKPCFLYMCRWHCRRMPRTADLRNTERVAAWLAQCSRAAASLESLSSSPSLSSSSQPPADASMSSPAGAAHGPEAAPRTMMRRISAACVKAACLTMDLVGEAFADRASFSRRNPFVISFLFAAILVIMANEIAALHHNPRYLAHAQLAISVLEHCAPADPQAKRLLDVATWFHVDVRARRSAVVGAAGHHPHLWESDDDVRPDHASPLLCIPPIADRPERDRHARDAGGYGSFLSDVPRTPYGPPPYAAAAARSSFDLSDRRHDLRHDLRPLEPGIRPLGDPRRTMSCNYAGFTYCPRPDNLYHHPHQHQPQSPPPEYGCRHVEPFAECAPTTLPPIVSVLHERQSFEGLSLCSDSTNGDVEFEATEGYLQAGVM
jgi:hypothetical protein